MTQQITYDDVKKHFESVGYTLLSTTYNHKQKLEYICNNGHKRTIKFHNFKNLGQRCNQCRTHHKNQYTKEEEQFLRNNYQTLGRNGCSEKLKRSSFSIGTKATKMGLVMTIKPVDSVNNKICCRCNNELSKSLFFNSKNRKDGKHPVCKKCTYIENQLPKNKIKTKIRYNRWLKHKMNTDINFRLVKRLRKRMKSAINGSIRLDRTMKMIGCTISEFRNHIEAQFTDGMTWENYGFNGWHIDHIIPCSEYNLERTENVYKCFHYTNLQPLWCMDNWSKPKGKHSIT